MTLTEPMPPEVEQFLIDEYQNSRVAKLRGLFALASSIKQGAIVELGVWRGRGLIALAFGAAYGAQVPVYGVDHWLYEVLEGQAYRPGDAVVCVEKLDRAGQLAAKLGKTFDAQLITGEVSEIAEAWTREPVGLIHWDVGVDLEEHFQGWSRLLLPGGIFAIHDTKDRRFGSDRVIDAALSRGYQLLMEDDGSSLYAVVKDRGAEG